MATTTTGHPGRTLIVLAVLIAGLFALIAAGNTWAPKLGLDLRGGTTITLTAENTSGTGAIDPNSLELARTIIQSRVDSLGVGESEVTTAGDRQLIVTVPNVQRDQLVELVGQTALLRFRAVYAAEQVTPPPAPEPTPQPTESTAPSTEPSASASVVPEPTPTANNKPMPALPTAPPKPVGEACVSADGQGTPPDQAIDWVPSEPCQAAFAEFTCGTPVDDVADEPLFACDEAGTEKYLLSPTLIEGDQLATASAGVPPNDVAWVVDLEFNSEGGTAFEEATRAPGGEAGAAEPLRHRPGRRRDLRTVGQLGDPWRPGADRGQLQPAERHRAGQRAEVRRAAAGLRRIGGQQRLRHPGR